MTDPGGLSCMACGHTPLEDWWTVDGWPLVRCDVCGLAAVDPQPDEEELRALYDAAYWTDAESAGYADYLAGAEARRHHARSLLTMLDRRRGSATPGALLEVGCAYGLFLAEARSLGWTVAGIEPSEPAAAHARSQGLEVLGSSLEEAELSNRAWDVIVMWDVIEHLSRPRAGLERVWEALRPGGILGFSTGDLGSLTARLQGRRWSLLTPPWHLFYFTERSVRLLLRSVGFTDLVIDRDGVVGVDPRADSQVMPLPLRLVLEHPTTIQLLRRAGLGMSMFVWAVRPEGVR